MKSTGMARKIDDLGRLVLPAEIRRRFGLMEGSHLEIHVDDGQIILTPLEDLCIFCGSADQLRTFRDRSVCAECVGQLSGAGRGAAAGADDGMPAIQARAQ